MHEYFIIHSASEADRNDGAGFWSNTDGWVEHAVHATRFTQEERDTVSLPMSFGNDARWRSTLDSKVDL